MCLIIVKRQGVNIPYDMLEGAFPYNPDSWGVMHVPEGTTNIYVRHGWDVNALTEYVKSLGDINMVIHFRSGYPGVKNLRNAHPFKVTNKIWMCHNGGIDIIKYVESGMNDTYHFATYELAPVLTGHEDKLEMMVPHIEERIGIGNKIVFLRNDGKVFIANEDEGFLYKGLWVSNGEFIR